MLYWNRCMIRDIEINPDIPGSEESFILDFLDFKPHFTFKVFAKPCNKFEDSSGCFDYKRYKPGTEIVVRIAGDLYMHGIGKQAEESQLSDEGFVTLINLKGDKKYFVMGHVTEKNPEFYQGRFGRVMKANNLYVYFTDSKDKIKKDDNVLISLNGILDLKE